MTTNEIALVIQLGLLGAQLVFLTLTIRNARACRRYAAQTHENARRMQELAREQKRMQSVIRVNATNQSIREFIDGSEDRPVERS